MKTYYLDLETLVHNLSEQSATLYAEFPKGVHGFAGLCTGSVRIHSGKIVNAVIEGKHGERLDGEQALYYLRSIKVWQVQFEQQQRKLSSQPTQPIPILPLPPLSPTGKVIKKLRLSTSIPPEYLRMLPPKEHMALNTVFSQIDGYRTLQQIKAQLYLPSEIVDRAIDMLRQMGLVE